MHCECAREKGAVRADLETSCHGVSEIIGVVMLLAMLISVMSGVILLIEPYLSDFEDQRNWASTHLLAEQISDRIEVIGAAPNGTGAKMSLDMAGVRIVMIEDVEEWFIQADLSDGERVELEVENGLVKVSCQNATCVEVRLIDDSDTVLNWSMQPSIEEQAFILGLSTQGVMIFEVLDVDGEVLHRMAMLSISGIKLITEMDRGPMELALINGAMIERRPGTAWSIEKFPTLRFDELPDGAPRLSLIFTDLSAGERLPDGGRPMMELKSMGATELFDGRVWNFRFKMSNQMHDIIDPQYVHHWTKGFAIHVATGTIDQYSGMAPYGRQSGVDGLTVLPAAEFILEVGIQRLEVSG